LPKLKYGQAVLREEIRLNRAKEGGNATVVQPPVRPDRFAQAVGSELWATGPLVLDGLLLGGLVAAWGLSP